MMLEKQPDRTKDAGEADYPVHYQVRSQPIQFSLLQVLITTSLLSVYFAIIHAAGHFMAGLVLGLAGQLIVLRIIRFDNLLSGALFCSALALGLLIGLGLLLGVVKTPYFIVSAILYPALGYFVGVCSVANYQFRMGV